MTILVIRQLLFHTRVCGKLIRIIAKTSGTPVGQSLRGTPRGRGGSGERDSLNDDYCHRRRYETRVTVNVYHNIVIICVCILQLVTGHITAKSAERTTWKSEDPEKIDCHSCAT